VLSDSRWAEFVELVELVEWVEWVEWADLVNLAGLDGRWSRRPFSANELVTLLEVAILSFPDGRGCVEAI